METRKLTIVILMIVVLVSYKSKAQSIAPNSEITTIGKKIDGYLTAMEAIGFSGAIVVSHNDKRLLSKGYGLAVRENGIPFTPQTIQSTGSNTKQFTGAAILLLENHNELSVNDRLTDHFDNVPEDKQQITLHQLLTHSSGLIQGVGYDKEPIEFGPFFKRIMAEPLEFEPGADYNYSNAGYSLLAKIIEKVSEVSYETFIRKNLLQPVGMMKTGYVLPNWNLGDMAIGYNKGDKWGQVYKNGWIGDGPNWHLRGNGGLHSTAEDMYKWLVTVKGKGALNKDLVEKWTTGYVTENNGYSEYGYGLVTYDDPKWGKVIKHSGSNGIFTSHFLWLPEREFFFYIHGNNSIIPAYSLEDDILNAAFEKKFEFPPIIESNDSIDSKTVKKKEGIYSHNGSSIELKADDIRLIGKLSGQGVLDLMFKHNTQEKEKFARLTSKMEEAMDKLEKGDESAFDYVVENHVASKKVTRSFQKRIIKMRRKLEGLNVIGTFRNIPGSDLYEYGPYTTFVHARFENWNQYWNLVWKEDGTYSGNYSGPWPEFTLIPVNEDEFRGIRGTPPWNIITIEFVEDGLKIENTIFFKS